MVGKIAPVERVAAPPATLTPSESETTWRLPDFFRLPLVAVRAATFGSLVLAGMLVETPALAGIAVGTAPRDGVTIATLDRAHAYFDKLTGLTKDLTAVHQRIDVEKRARESSRLGWLASLFDNGDDEAELESLQTAYLKTKRQVTTLDEDAYAALRARGLKAYVPAESRDGLVGVLVFVDALEKRTGRRLVDMPTNAQANLLKSRLRTTEPHALRAKLHWLRTIPRAFLHDFVGWGDVAENPPSLRTIVAAHVLIDAGATVLAAEDLRLLENLDDDRRHELTALVQTLTDAGWRFTGDGHPRVVGSKDFRRTELQAIADLAVPDDIVPLDLTDPVSAKTMRISVSSTAFIEAVRRHAQSGGTPTASLLEYFLLTSATEPNAASRFARSLGASVTLDARPGAVRTLLALAFDASDDVVDAMHTFLQASAQRLDRKLSTSEAKAYLARHAAGESLDDILPPGSLDDALAMDPNATAADVYLWSHLTQEERSQDRTAMLHALRGRLVPGPSRADTSADYKETLNASAHKLTRSDLARIHVVLDILQRPDIVQAIAKHLDADLENKNTEFGGTFREVDGKRTFLPITPTKTKSNNVFIYPNETHDPMQQFVTAHFHVGGAEFAGPSSSHGGFFGDRGWSWSQARADLVITRLTATTFNVDYYTPNGAVLDLGVCGVGEDFLAGDV